MSTEFTAGQVAVAGDKDVLARDLRRVMRDADALLQDVGSTTAEGLAMARGMLDAKVGEVKVRLAETGSAVARKARATADVGRTYVADNPWTAVAIAVAVGLAVGLLTTRR